MTRPRDTLTYSHDARDPGVCAANGWSWFTLRALFATGRFAAMLGLTLLAGCPGNLENADKFPSKNEGISVDGSINCDIKDVFNRNCGSSLCHEAGGMPGGNLALADSKTTIVDVDAKLIDQCAAHAACPECPVGCPKGDKYVDTQNPANSWLLHKIEQSGDDTLCGDWMPDLPGGPNAMPPLDLACIKAYIQNAQPRDGGAVSCAGSGGTTDGGGGTSATGSGGTAGTQ
ncbi:MAG TPA: hypothetical protein VGM29_05210 [Polyangiaceae bacterium]